MSGFTHERGFVGETNEWYTPPWLFEQLGLEFDLDPCAPPGGIPWIPAKTFWSRKDNSLSRPWHGRVWLNPPYGPFTKPFLRKMNEHRNGIALVFARTDTQWFHNEAVQADAMLFIAGRISFIRSNGSGSTTAGAPSMLLAWNEDCVEAIQRIQGFFVRLK